MDDLINTKAKQLFNIGYVFPYQRLIITNTLRAAGYYGVDEKTEVLDKQIVLLPTGSGKSLCFMLPGILLDGITLIVFPLLSLMADQERRIIEAGASVTTLKGGMTKEEISKSYKEIREGSVKFILTNPETLGTSKVLSLLKEGNITHVVIDEAHTVSQWGESFRPAYLDVGNHIKNIGVSLITAYTATASDYIVKSILKNIFLNDEVNVVRGDPDRTNIHYSALPSLSKDESLLKLISISEKPIIIFHSSRVSAEVTNRFLLSRMESTDIVYYHAGLTKDEKQSIEEWFFSSNTGILNATCAYGMGIDKANIRTVIHLNAPTSIEAYLQESGRAGRDRKPAKAVVLTSPMDEKNLIAEIFTDNSRCRRESLVKLLGGDIEICSGCDVCNNNLQTEELGKLQIIKFIQKNSNLFNISQSCSILKGLYTFNTISNQYHNIPGFGILREWDLDSIKEAITGLIKTKMIRPNKNPFFKGLLLL